MKHYIMPFILLLLLAGCKTVSVQHPGSIDSFDSKTYDTLLIAQSILDNAKVAVKQGKLPDTAKPVINNAGKAYGELRDLWLDYRANPNATLAERITQVSLEINRFILELRNMGVAQ